MGIVPNCKLRLVPGFLIQGHIWSDLQNTQVTVGSCCQQKDCSYQFVLHYSSIVTHSDKRGTKSMGRSRDNCRKHHPRVISSNTL